MHKLENNEELMPAKKAESKEYTLSPLEASIQARKHNLNFPALQAMFELTAEELQTILDKLPPTEDCNC